MPDPNPDSLYLSNWNYGGFPVFLGFVAAPAMIVGISWYWITGRAAAEIVDGFTLAYAIGATALTLLLAGMFVHLAFSAGILWIRFGDSIEYRLLMRRRTVAWSQVKQVRLVTEASKLAGPAAGISYTFGQHRVLQISLTDGSELRVLLRSYSYKLARILRKHGFDLPAGVY